MKNLIKKYKEQIILSVCSFALLFAPIIAGTQASGWMWQERKIPNSLKN
jgi:hypothetical protein